MTTETIEDLREVNVFYLDHDPELAARAHCDRHVLKMVIETAQLLSAVWHTVAPDALESTIGSTDPAFPLHPLTAQLEAKVPFGQVFFIGNQLIYAPTHLNHPAVEWARESRGCYDWLWRLGAALADEYTFRYRKLHATRHVLRTLERPPPGLPAGEHSEPPLVMPEEFFVTASGYADAVDSYRKYYLEGKRHLLTYTRRAPPSWARGVATHREVPAGKV